MKQIMLIIACLTSSFSFDINTAVELGLKKKNLYMSSEQRGEISQKADDKLDMRLLYLKFLQSRQSAHVTKIAINKIESLKGSTTALKDKELEYEKLLLDTKSLLETVTDQKIDDINTPENINLSQLKNRSLESLITQSLKNSQHMNLLEQELDDYDTEKSDWNIDVSGAIMYGHEKAKRSNKKSRKRNTTDAEVNIVLTNNSDFENDSTIEVAQKRADLQKRNRDLNSDIKTHAQEYIKALEEYKSTKDALKKSNLQTEKEIQEAYTTYINSTKALYNVYRKYIRLLNIIEKE